MPKRGAKVISLCDYRAKKKAEESGEFEIEDEYIIPKTSLWKRLVTWIKSIFVALFKRK